MSEHDNVSVFILCRDLHILEPTVNFLRRRDWHVSASNSLSDSVKHIVQTQPMFLMISMNHPNKKVQNFHKMIAQVYKGTIIIFCEANERAAVRRMQRLNAKYSLYPPIGGPAIERGIRKILMQKENEEKSLKNVSDMSQASPSDSIKISGPKNSKNPESHIIASKGHSPNSIIVGQGNKSEQGIESSYQSTKPGSNIIMQQHSSAALGNQTEANNIMTSSLPDNVQGLNSTGLNSSENSGHHVNHANNIAQLNALKNGNNESHFHQSSNEVGQNDMQSLQESKNPEMNSHLQSENGALAHSNLQNSSSVNHQPSFQNDSHSPVMSNVSNNVSSDFNNQSAQSGPEAESLANSLMGHESSSHPGESSPEEVTAGGMSMSMLEEGLKQALESSISPSSRRNHLVEVTSKVACLEVNAKAFKGYIVAAYADTKAIDRNLIYSIKTEFFKFLKENGHPTEDEDWQNLEIEKVPFKEWTEEFAEFLRSEIHAGDEIAMAFFPRADLKAVVEETENETMVSVSIDELDGDSKVNFDLFIYLPNNKKFIKYTKKGFRFYEKQKSHLKTKGMEKMYLDKADVIRFDEYRTQKYLNDSVSQFFRKKKAS